MMIKETLSFGIFMLVINTITLTISADLMYRVARKIWALRHPHIIWPAGVVLLGSQCILFGFNLLQFSTSYVNYLITPKPVWIWTIAARVCGQVLMLLYVFMLWYYKVKVPKLELFK